MTTSAKILLVEDDGIAARYLVQSLPRLGYQITGVAQTGEEVIRQIEENLPDIILMDITLGGKIDGISAIKKMQEQINIPVIYLTANSDVKMFERAKDTKPYAYIVKPYEIFQLQNAIEIALLKHKMDNQLMESETRYRTIFEISDTAMMLVDENSIITMVNKKFEKLTGCSRASAEKIKSWTEFFVESERLKLEKLICQSGDVIKSTQGHFEAILENCQGISKTVYLNVSKFPGTNNSIVSMNDISDLKQAEQKILQLNVELQNINKGLNQEIFLRERIERQLRYKATHDHLTGLPNRVLLFDRLKQAFAFEERHNTLVAVMILDLDNFKTINDTMGHLSGDILLKNVALVLQKCMRQYDTVGRLGGDEFVIIINDTETIKDIISFAEKVQALFQEPFDILGHKTYVTTSMGVAVHPLHGHTIETLLLKADMAMYVAKSAGRNTFRLYSESMDLRDSTQKNMRAKRRVSLLGQSARDDFFQHGASGANKDEIAH